MSFRFRVQNDDKITFTQWHDEPDPSPAPQIATKIRQANPSAVLSIERRVETADELNKSDKSTEM